MLYNYKSVDANGEVKQGSIEAVSSDVAITSLQRRGLVISSITASEKPSVLSKISFFDRVSVKDIVIFSRQIATLFEAQVSALRVFRLLADETENKRLAAALREVADDIQGGSSISKALGKHPKVFSEFYVNMVLSGEESGKLDQTFLFLADYLDRSYEITSKARNALIYPLFIVVTLLAVMTLMFTVVVPRITAILVESGQPIPFYTQIVIFMSYVMLNYGIFILIGAVVGGYFLMRFAQTEAGKLTLSRLKISIPYVGGLYRKLYLSRIADNMNTMILSGISMVRVIEITASVVDNRIYHDLLIKSAEAVRGGRPLSDALAEYEEVPGIMTQMMKIGEETGELGNILKTLARFYEREVSTAVDTLVDLIEPVMIVSLGLSVGFILISVLVPIYNLSSAF